MSAPMSDSRIVSRSLAQRGLSTAVTVATVAVGVALMLSLLGLSRAADALFTRGTGNMHLLVTAEPSATDSVLNSVFYAAAPGRAINWDQFQAQAARVPLEWQVPTQLGDSFRGSPVLGTSNEFFEKFEPVAGEPWAFAEGGPFEDPFDIVLGSAAAQRLGLKIGDHLHITHGFGSGAEHAGHDHDEFEWTVRGVLEPSGTMHDNAVFQTVEAAWIVHAQDRREAGGEHVHDLTTLDDLTPADRLVTGVYVRVATRPGRDATAVLPQVRNQFTAMGYTAVSPSEKVRQILDTVGNVEVVLVAMAGVVLLSSGLGIFLALYNSMEQRRRQIAVLRVLGASRGRVLRLVLLESLVIGLLGVVVGWLLTIGGAALVTEFLRERLGFGVRPVLALPLVAMVSLGALALALLAGLVPAVRAYRVSVVRNLRPVG